MCTKFNLKFKYLDFFFKLSQDAVLLTDGRTDRPIIPTGETGKGLRSFISIASNTEVPYL
jgi:hypothetical protein